MALSISMYGLWALATWTFGPNVFSEVSNVMIASIYGELKNWIWHNTDKLIIYYLATFPVEMLLMVLYSVLEMPQKARN